MKVDLYSRWLKLLSITRGNWMRFNRPVLHFWLAGLLGDKCPLERKSKARRRRNTRHCPGKEIRLSHKSHGSLEQWSERNFR